MKKNTYYFLFFVFALGIAGCKNDINILAPYQANTIIYGVLDPGQPVQYIRINKTFLGAGNANTMATVSDSFNYKPSEINVQLEQLDNAGNHLSFVPLQYSFINTNSGAFNNSGQLVYTTKQRIAQGDTAYKIIVTRNSDHKVITAKTNIVNNLVTLGGLASPNEIISFSSLLNIGASDTGSYSTPGVFLQWNPTLFGRLYHLTIRLHFIDRYKNGTSAPDSIDWDLGNQTVQTVDTIASSQTPMSMLIPGISFYQFLYDNRLTNFSNPNIVNRYVNEDAALDFIFETLSDNFNTYYNLNSGTSTSIAQLDKPLYTNVTGGYGIFTSRNTYIIKNKKINDGTISNLIYGTYTRILYNMNFVNK